MYLPDRVVNDVATELLKRGSGGGDGAGHECRTAHPLFILSNQTYSAVRMNEFSILSEETLV